MMIICGRGRGTRVEKARVRKRDERSPAAPSREELSKASPCVVTEDQCRRAASSLT